MSDTEVTKDTIDLAALKVSLEDHCQFWNESVQRHEAFLERNPNSIFFDIHVDELQDARRTQAFYNRMLERGRCLTEENMPLGRRLETATQIREALGQHKLDSMRGLPYTVGGW